MKRKTIYSILFLVVLAAILGPVIYPQKINNPQQAPETSPGKKAINLQALNLQKDGQAFEGEQTPLLESIKKDQEQKETRSTSSRFNEPQADPQANKETFDQVADSATKNNYPKSVASEQGSETMLARGEKENGCIVEIALVGKNSELLYGPLSVTVSKTNTRGMTVLSVLDATGIPYELSPRWSNFIESIAGLPNKGQAGWMYKVNDEVPLVAGDQKTVKNGDRVIWWYSKSIDTPPPNWDELIVASKKEVTPN